MAGAQCWLLALSPDLLIWKQFKSFLQKTFGDSQVFVDNTWSKVKQAAQYQLEGVQDFASYLKYLQSVLLEFDNGNLDESYLVRFFRNGLRPLIKVQMKNGNKKLHNWEDLIQKAIKAKGKTSFLPLSMLREMDQRVVCKKRLAENNKATT